MGCCYSEPESGSSATVYHEIKPTVIPTYTNIIRSPSVRLPPVANEVLPSAPPSSPIMQPYESFRAQSQAKALKKKKKSQV